MIRMVLVPNVQKHWAIAEFHRSKQKFVGEYFEESKTDIDQIRPNNETKYRTPKKSYYEIKKERLSQSNCEAD